jgi:hypothetical protein
MFHPVAFTIGVPSLATIRHRGVIGATNEVIPILRVADAGVALAWYQRLGFDKEWEHRFGDGMPAFVSIARGNARLFLSEHSGDARPNTLVYIVVPDVDTVAAEFGATREDAPYGCDFELRDPDGNRLRIAAPNA